MSLKSKFDCLFLWQIIRSLIKKQKRRKKRIRRRERGRKKYVYCLPYGDYIIICTWKLWITMPVTMNNVQWAMALCCTIFWVKRPCPQLFLRFVQFSFCCVFNLDQIGQYIFVSKYIKPTNVGALHCIQLVPVPLPLPFLHSILHISIERLKIYIESMLKIIETFKRCTLILLPSHDEWLWLCIDPNMNFVIHRTFCMRIKYNHI